MGRVCWNFPLLGTDSVSGSNDGNITMFKGSGIMDGLAREVCQNSLDAKNSDLPDGTPVRVVFKLFYLERKQFSVFDEFERALESAYDYWTKNPLKTKKIMDFLDNVKKYLSMDRIPVLIMSDYNTNGLQGVNAGPGETSYWDLLVNTKGI